MGTIMNSKAKVCKKTKIAAKDFIQMQKFSVLDGDVVERLVVYIKRGSISTVKLLPGSMPNAKRGAPLWVTYDKERSFVATRVWRNDMIYVHEYSSNLTSSITPLDSLKRKWGQACMLGNGVMITGGSGSVELLKFDENNSHLINVIQCESKIPLFRNSHNMKIFKHSVTRVTTDMVILTGGYTNDGESSRAYRGVLSKKGHDVDWKQLPSMSQVRANHVSFYLNGNAYVVGGFVHYSSTTSSKTYDVDAERWSEGPALPYSLQHQSAFVNHGGNFALVFGIEEFTERKLKVIIIDEQKYFMEVTELSLQNCLGRVLILPTA